MLCWWSILMTLCLNLLVSAVNFHGVGDVTVGDNISLGLEMGKDDNFDPFDLILQSTGSDGAPTMLQHIANVSLTFTVTISIPQLPNGFYIYCAAEPDSNHTFSRSNRFLITNNSTDNASNSSPPRPNSTPEISPVAPSTTSSPPLGPSLLPGAPHTDIRQDIENIKAENTRLLIIIGVISAALGLGLVIGLVIYLRLRERRWLEMISPIQFDPRRESVVRLGAPRIPEPKFSTALSDSLEQDAIPPTSVHDHARRPSVHTNTSGVTRTEDPPPVYV